MVAPVWVNAQETIEPIGALILIGACMYIGLFFGLFPTRICGRLRRRFADINVRSVAYTSVRTLAHIYVRRFADIVRSRLPLERQDVEVLPVRPSGALTA